jgi:molecular chaperone GrpE
MADETVPEAKAPAPETNGDAPVEATEASERVAALEAEVSGLKDRMLRTMAEMENLRRRTERELSDTRQYAVANFARDMLTVSDNLRRALEAVPAESRGDVDPVLAALIEGVEVTERGLAQTLQKFGIRPIDPKGEKFDPAHHQAMFEVDNPDLPSGTVAEVVQTGYVIGERVLRPALVAVAKGGPKTAKKGKPKPVEAETAAKAKVDSEGNSQSVDADPAD